jgi:hypothetical protein
MTYYVDPTGVLPGYALHEPQPGIGFTLRVDGDPPPVVEESLPAEVVTRAQAVRSLMQLGMTEEQAGAWFDRTAAAT